MPSLKRPDDPARDGFRANRREFLKLAGLGLAGASAGCATRSHEQIIPYLVAPEDVLPGVANWYASTCRECPAGCGILVKAREGRAIKIEGNPAHPVNRGGLCARGHAALQGLYNPDRVRTPVSRTDSTWRTLTWDAALARVTEHLKAARAANRGIALVVANEPGSSLDLAREWAAAAGATLLVYEAFGFEAVREANRRDFGQAVIPSYDFERAELVISFGADFLESFGSPVAQARGFAAMRERPESGWFFTVEPRLSATGANADEWIAARAGTEAAVALGMVNVILREGLGQGPAELVAAWTPEVVERETDVPAETIVRVAQAFARRRPSLALAGGIAAQSEQATALVSAVNLLNHVVGNVGQTVRFDRPVDYGAVASFAEAQKLIQSMAAGTIDLLVVAGGDPAFSMPAWAGFVQAMEKVRFKVAIANAVDDTAGACDLVLPSLHPLECLGDSRAVPGVWSLQQPAMRMLPLVEARSTGDTLIALAKSAGFGSFPASWEEYLKGKWQPLHQRFGGGADFQAFWDSALARGGVWEEPAAPAAAPTWQGTPAFALPEWKGEGEYALVVFPTHVHDGRGANKPWLQELPDRTSSVVWNSWIELHPQTARRLGIETGDPVAVKTEQGVVQAQAYLYSGLRPEVVAVPLGRGHTAFGRYAQSRGVNPLVLLPPAQDAASGALAYLCTRVRLEKAGARPNDGFPPLAMTQPQKQQSDRGIAQGMPVAAFIALRASGGLAGYVLQPGAGEGTRAGAAHPPPPIPGAPPEEQAHIPAGLGKVGPRGTNVGVLLETPPMQRRLGKFTEPRALKPGEVIPPQSITAYEPLEKVRAPRAIPVTQGSYSRPLDHHRWAMAINLNACTGCQSCVVACYAENNVPTVGPEIIRRGRSMAWLRIERYEEVLQPGAMDVRFLPMLCQHCTYAPCETVCPVFAAYHNPEGLNAQLYNRCVGTRYCSNNCPYKVREFNWFDYAAPEKRTFAFPEPLNWQLNPDVTVRSKGVMEKCSFCVQRILEGKGRARDEGRTLRDGEIQTACQQSCPSGAIVFGDLLDPASRVARLSADERRYWIFNELNTQPGITYLKKFQRESELA